MRDALDGMEQLASMMAYGRLPEDLEILAIGADIEFEETIPEVRPSAEIIQLDWFRVSIPHQSPNDQSTADTAGSGKNNKIRML